MEEFKEFEVIAKVRLAMYGSCAPNHDILSETIDAAIRKAGVNILVGSVNIESREIEVQK